ncbi:hypothetical protein HUG15_06620 [Salicibibacter cibarius]|uniref:Integrase SAM-like N-terminal domain-containing protein n=1 Tax=Salicibibacter cibarius TaxID=2743000 RepID=A0A7T6Z1L0_9BACI|nr:hypothetical protein [Salicibibacter cibarius]QQK75295.1 hypothetical protein HUG15_06620 [Salicibibacter cibarius]
MNQLDAILEVQKLADKNRKRKTATNEHYTYLHAINDFMSERGKKMHPDDADHLKTFLLRNFWIE